jgi:hypothetical protein
MGAATQWIESSHLHNGCTKSPELGLVGLALTIAFQQYQICVDWRRTGGDMVKVL